MTKKEENTELGSAIKNSHPVTESDTAGKSLSEALELSFTVLKVIMVILVIAFFASGFKTVGTEEKALVLRFGKIRGTGPERVLGPGPHWIWPYPIDEIIRIPTAGKDNLEINSFWYYLTEREQLSGKADEIDTNKALDPLRDGYCLTRSGNRDPNSTDNQGNDYNIVHTQWQLTYHIDNPELFFTNIQIPNVKPGDIYNDVIKKGMEPLLKNMFEDIVVTKMVNYTIDEAVTSRERIPAEVKESLQRKLDSIDSGIEIVSVQLTKSEVPRQVKKVFEATTIATMNRSDAIKQADTKARKLLLETAGPDARKLYDSLHDDKMTQEQKEILWSQLSGKLMATLTDARRYAATVAKNAEASAKYLQSLLPEYRKYPDVVINRLYYDTMVKVLSNADEKFTIQTSAGASGSEIWINLNRDTSLRPKTKEGQTTQDGSR
jgi:modulator of FtsH protease HflK